MKLPGNENYFLSTKLQKSRNILVTTAQKQNVRRLMNTGNNSLKFHHTTSKLQNQTNLTKLLFKSGLIEKISIGNNGQPKIASHARKGGRKNSKPRSSKACPFRVLPRKASIKRQSSIVRSVSRRKSSRPSIQLRKIKKRRRRKTAKDRRRRGED
ncbi:hypothetical protein CDAR_545671 [Caerostris darwini]|uniref:Uncharacterized protein n=1 Tax=Caerostris darwini TaxID=1538125 RepID=A0AAV4WWR2_9ARAC|nr:hypothetical protein CDAR_545671 [Caerostris darwini]